MNVWLSKYYHDLSCMVHDLMIWGYMTKRKPPGPCSFKLSRWILMAISTPSLVLARCTCPSDAAASGLSSNSAKSSPDEGCEPGLSANDVCTKNVHICHIHAV